MKIVRNYPKKLLGVCQQACIKKLLEHFLMPISRLIDTPIEKGLTLYLDQCPKTDHEKRGSMFPTLMLWEVQYMSWCVCDLTFFFYG